MQVCNSVLRDATQMNMKLNKSFKNEKQIIFLFLTFKLQYYKRLNIKSMSSKYMKN